MFEIAFGIGIFSYIIFFLGLLGLLYKPVLVGISVLYWLVFLVLERNLLRKFSQSIRLSKWSFFFSLGVIYIVLQILINFIGLLGPEIGFDATWYHLTLPKLYLLYHSIIHIPGGILYYSDMPKLTEMLYTAGLAFGSDFWARGIHFFFAILASIAIYKLGRKFFSANWAIFLPVIFLSNLVVGWESISAYIDLARTFFEVLTLWAFLNWFETKDRKWLIWSAVILGLTVATKLLAIGDVVLYAVALVLFNRKALLSTQLKQVSLFVGLALLCPLPWFVFSFIHTGNPLYPMLSSTYQMPSDTLEIFKPSFFITTFWTTFARASDPINPIFLAVIPFLAFSWKKISHEYPIILYFALGGFLIWYLTPQTGGGRYILPYLPLFSLVVLLVITNLSTQWQKVFITFIAFTVVISLIFRGIANAKFIPVITGHQSKASFMAKHLQFNLGDFYDVDGYFASHIKPTDTVLLYGFHNLYYVNFPFIHNTWVQKGDRFNYIAVQGNGIPDRFKYWDLIYYNNTSQVRVYSFKGQTWFY